MMISGPVHPYTKAQTACKPMVCVLQGKGPVEYSLDEVKA